MGNSLQAAKLGKDFEFRGQRKVKVVDVYDGDTVRIVFKYGREMIQWKGRMYGYDSPEMKPRLDSPGRDKEKQAAQAAKVYLENMLPKDRIVEANMMGFDKYGRILLVLSYRGTILNNEMVNHGHGLPYFGGTKTLQQQDE